MKENIIATLIMLIVILLFVIFIMYINKIETKCNNLGGIYLDGNCIKVESIKLD